MADSHLCPIPLHFYTLEGITQVTLETDKLNRAATQLCTS